MLRGYSIAILGFQLAIIKRPPDGSDAQAKRVLLIRFNGACEAMHLESFTIELCVLEGTGNH